MTTQHFSLPMDTSSDPKGDVIPGIFNMLACLLGMKAWVKVSVNITLVVMHLAYLIKPDFNKV